MIRLAKKRPINPNAAKALEEMKLEIANELGLGDKVNNSDSVENIFTAGNVGGQMTRKLVEMGEKEFMNRNRRK